MRRTSTDRIFVVFAIAVALIAAGTHKEAWAQAGRTVCAPHANMIALLKNRFEEDRSAVMLDNRGNLMELFGNRVTGSWTLTITQPGGPTCILNAGEYFVPETKTASADDQGS